MVFDLLPSLRPCAKHATVCVRVSRRWEYRGGTDDGPIGLVDLVLIDQKAEIPRPEVETKAPLILEGGVYMISRFKVSNAKFGYRLVLGEFMIEFTCYTRIEPMREDISDFPEYTYHLTSLADLPARVGDTRSFIDVIGTLVEVSEVRTVHLPNKPAPTLTRDIVLMGLSNTDMKVTLWGHRASDFTIHDVYNAEDPRHVVVLLVGCLMKSFQGQDYLSANTTCRWYFNPTIPEAEPFYSKLQHQRIEIRHVDAPAAEQAQPQPLATPETMFLTDLESIDPYDFPLGSHVPLAFFVCTCL
ncbi:hypothetical protein BS78_04G224700 [Paspalum vaginatum]|nr:hypothetical protein BS78_04G224700 [Paspalum vaginatum]